EVRPVLQEAERDIRRELRACFKGVRRVFRKAARCVRQDLEEMRKAWRSGARQGLQDRRELMQWLSQACWGAFRPVFPVPAPDRGPQGARAQQLPRILRRISRAA
ncbi:unnamed protein product, partial [Symbiodinium pilosum]